MHTLHGAEDIVVNAYDRILSTTIQWLEKMAVSKIKYAHIVRLENYYFMWKFLHSFPDTMLVTYATQCQTVHEKSLREYAMWCWTSQMASLTHFVEEVETLLQSVPMTEIQFHIPKSKLLAINAEASKQVTIATKI